MDLRKVPRQGVERDDFLLFSETPGRFAVTVSPASSQTFELMMGASAARIGYVTEDTRLVVTGLGGSVIIDSSVAVLKEAWQRPLRFEESD